MQIVLRPNLIEQCQNETKLNDQKLWKDLESVDLYGRHLQWHHVSFPGRVGLLPRGHIRNLWIGIYRSAKDLSEFLGTNVYLHSGVVQGLFLQGLMVRVMAGCCSDLAQPEMDPLLRAEEMLNELMLAREVMELVMLGLTPGCYRSEMRAAPVLIRAAGWDTTRKSAVVTMYWELGFDEERATVLRNRHKPCEVCQEGPTICGIRQRE